MGVNINPRISHSSVFTNQLHRKMTKKVFPATQFYKDMIKNAGLGGLNRSHERISFESHPQLLLQENSEESLDVLPYPSLATTSSQPALSVSPVNLER